MILRSSYTNEVKHIAEPFPNVIIIPNVYVGYADEYLATHDDVLTPVAYDRNVTVSDEEYKTAEWLNLYADRVVNRWELVGDAVSKHLSGKHDQSTHAGGKVGKVVLVSEQERIEEELADSQWMKSNPEAYARFEQKLRERGFPHNSMYRKGDIEIVVDHDTATMEQVERIIDSAQAAYDKVPASIKEKWAKEGMEDCSIRIASDFTSTRQSNAAAATFRGKPSIIINPATLSSWDSVSDLENYHSVLGQKKISGYDWILTHEMGHAIDFSSDENLSNFMYHTNAMYSDEMGWYSRSNHREAFAEIFAAHAFGADTELTNTFAEEFGWNK